MNVPTLKYCHILKLQIKTSASKSSSRTYSWIFEAFILSSCRTVSFGMEMNVNPCENSNSGNGFIPQSFPCQNVVRAYLLQQSRVLRQVNSVPKCRSFQFIPYAESVCLNSRDN
ncbi:hypothetical protein NPIL_87011 [Nephila pilipes]|uniref:Uncharacterized protein n=1 Tax=Nephila pilipes TaxID=299642 RepID=A0A8X6MZ36_NEPPI|nr:hypothetical protein NPIL_87011 [Nephila pilipes]